MKEEVREFASRLKPPGHDAAPEEVQAWRWFVALTTGVTAMGLTAHIIIACGYAATLGFAGFAKAEDIAGVRQEMAAVKLDLRNKRAQELAALLLDTKQKQCVAMGEAKRLYLASYNNLRSEYFMLNGREFPDPPCSDFQ